MAESFVYCWTDLGMNKLYVGVHKGTPDDGYVCSSKPMMEEYTKRPNDFSRQIISFGTYPEMYVLESAILKAAGADKDPGYYNLHINNGKFSMFGKRHSDITIQKMREWIRTPEHCANMSSAKSSEIQKELSRQIGLRNRGMVRTEEFKARHRIRFSGRNNPRFGILHTSDTKAIISETRKGKSYVVHGKMWIIKSSSGTTETQNIAEFCRKNDLKRSGISWAYHKNKSYMGFRVTRVEL